MENNEVFCLRVRELLWKNKMSQNELAEKIDADASTVSRLISGERRCRVDVLMKIADTFGVSADYLLGRSDEM